MKIVRRNEGLKLQVLGDNLQIKLASKESSNGMAVISVEVPPGGMVPPHRHRDTEEGYLILSGTLTMTSGSEQFELGDGDFAHVPPGALHGYQNRGAQPCRFLAWTIGGALDQFFSELSETVKSVPQDLDKMGAILAKHNIYMEV